MMKELVLRLTRTKLFWTGSIALIFGLGLLSGVFLNYAVGVDRPIARQPIRVDYCFLFSHEDLFRGQPIETEANYSLVIEGAGIDKEECPESTASFSGPPAYDPVGREWDKDIERQRSPAEFKISFVGIIPSHPRYRDWYYDTKNLWQPIHHIPFNSYPSTHAF